jgi:hypothetical protein
MPTATCRSRTQRCSRPSHLTSREQLVNCRVAARRPPRATSSVASAALPDFDSDAARRPPLRHCLPPRRPPAAEAALPPLVRRRPSSSFRRRGGTLPPPPAPPPCSATTDTAAPSPPRPSSPGRPTPAGPCATRSRDPTRGSFSAWLCRITRAFCDLQGRGPIVLLWAKLNVNGRSPSMRPWETNSSPMGQCSLVPLNAEHKFRKKKQSHGAIQTALKKCFRNTLYYWYLRIWSLLV